MSPQPLPEPERTGPLEQQSRPHCAPVAQLTHGMEAGTLRVPSCAKVLVMLGTPRTSRTLQGQLCAYTPFRV